MKVKIKQRMSYDNDCVICGCNNPAGIGAEFYETEDGRVLCVFTGKSIHRSFPHIMHGGMSAAILDDCMGRTIQLSKPELWGLTLEMQLTYKRPVPYDETCYALAELIEESEKIYSSKAYLLLPNGEIAATSEGKFYKVDNDYLCNHIDDPSLYHLNENAPHPEYIELPQIASRKS